MTCLLTDDWGMCHDWCALDRLEALAAAPERQKATVATAWARLCEDGPELGRRPCGRR